MDAGSQENEVQGWKDVYEQRLLTARAWFCTALSPGDIKVSKEAMRKKLDEIKKDRPRMKLTVKPGLFFGHYKLLMDGIATLPALSAAFLKPYNDPLHTRVEPNYNSSFLHDVGSQSIVLTVVADVQSKAVLLCP
jgi:hypothetical protein